MNYIRSFKESHRNVKLVVVGIFLVMFAFGIYNATYYNFITEVLNIQPEALGRLEALRELPGILMVLFGLVTVYLADRTTGALCAIIAAVGFGAYTKVTTIESLLLWTFVWSVGMHIWFPLQSSLILSFAPKGRDGKYLGLNGSLSAIAGLSGMGIVAIIGKSIDFHVWYGIVAVLMVIGAVILMFVPKHVGEVNRVSLAFKKKFTSYYVLIFLEGCRKQVFITFAVFVLTREFATPVKIIAMLMMLNNLVNIFGFPIVGRLVDKIGERIILRVSYFLLIFVYIGYAYIPNVHFLYLMYILDNVFYLSSMCLTSYVKKLCEPAELLTTLSTGQTFNHLAACVVPIVGGIAWAKYGYPFTFIGGIGVVLISFFYATVIPKHKKKVVNE